MDAIKVWWQFHRRAVLTLTGAFFLTTVPFLSKFPFNWDAAQFNLALHTYNIGMHQPHPPGYPLFIVLGKLLNWAMGDNLALVTVSALFGLISVIMLYVFSYRLSNSRFIAALVALCWLLNPLFWLYREVALTYTVDAAASITMGYLVWQTMTKRDRHYLIASSIVLVIAGAIRPSLLMLLFPLLVFQSIFHRRNWKLLCLVVGIIALGTAAWLIPVWWLSGGVGEYITYSRNLYGTAAESLQTWPQTKLVFNTIFSSLNLVLLPILAGLIFLVMRYLRLWKKVWPVYVYAAVWILPALFMYCLIHFGQVGYALIIVIPFYLLLIPFLRWLQTMKTGWLRYSLVWGSAAVLLVHAAVFLVLTPAYGHPNFFPTTRAELYLQHLARWTPNLFKWNRTIIADSDRYLAGVADIAEHYPTDETIIVTGRDILYPSPANGLLIRNDEVFREVSYLLPNNRVYEIAPSRDYYLYSQHSQMSVVHNQTVTIPNEIRYVLFILDVIPSGMQPKGLQIEAVTIPGTNHQLQVGVIDQPWTMGPVTFARQADQITNLHDSR